MATGVQNVNLSNYDAMSSDIPRQLRLAQALQEQANAPIEIQSYKGIQAPIPWTAVLAKALGSYAGARQERKAEEKKTALKAFERSSFADAIRKANSPLTTEGRPEILEGDVSPALGTNLDGSGVQEAQIAQLAQQPRPTAPPVDNGPLAQNVSSGQRMAAAMASLGGNAQPSGMVPAAPPGMAPAGAMAPMPRRVFQEKVDPTSRARTGSEMMDLASEYMNSPVPQVQAYGAQMLEKATKEIGKEKMVNAIKAVDIGDADPAIMNLYMSGDNPGGAIDYLSKFGMAKAEAAAKIAEIQLRAKETAEQRDLDRQSREAMADQSSADRRAMADQASADRRLGYSMSAANSAASRDLTRSLAEQRVAKVPAKIQFGYSANNASIKQIDDAISAIETNKGHLGLLNALGDETNQRRDPKGVDVRAKVSDITSLKRHDRSGAAVTFVETPYLKPFLPSVTDTDKTAVKKLRHLKENLQNANAEMETEFNVSSPSAGKPDPLGLRN